MKDVGQRLLNLQYGLKREEFDLCRIRVKLITDIQYLISKLLNIPVHFRVLVNFLVHVCFHAHKHGQ